jgi:hypothetical protein
MKMLASPAAAAIAVLTAVAGSANAQCFDPQKIVPTGTASSDSVGSIVRLSGTSMLTGAPGVDLPGKADAGAVYAHYWVANIQNQFTWDQYARLTAADSAAGAAFGRKVAFGDPWTAIQAPGMPSGGAVYMFVRSGNAWQQMQKINAPTAAEEFGYSMDVDGDWMIIGSPGDDHGTGGGPSLDYGSVRLYKRTSTTWTQNWYFARSSVLRRINDRFGHAVALRGSVAVAGMPNFYDTLTQSTIGMAFMYARSGDTWSPTGAVLAPDNAHGDQFGASVATDGDWVFVGAPDKNNGVGAVYVFRRSGGANFEFQQKLIPVTPAIDGKFGSSLSVHSGRLAVGSEGAKRTSVFIRAGDQWHHDFRLSDPDTAASGSFASSVSITGQHLAVGDMLDDSGGLTNSGAVYAYRITTNAADMCEAAPIATQGMYTGCNTAATLDGNALCYGLSTSPDVWYKYVAACTGSVEINTFGSLFNTVLSVHTGCPGTASNAIACNDNWSPFELNAQLTFSVVQGQTYFIRIGGVGGQRGAYVLNVGACIPAPACYANCDQSTTAPALNVEDFTCFINRFAVAQGLPHAQQVSHYANCDNSTTAPVLNVEDFTCFINRYAMGCP